MYACEQQQLTKSYTFFKSQSNGNFPYKYIYRPTLDADSSSGACDPIQVIKLSTQLRYKIYWMLWILAKQFKISVTFTRTPGW